MHKFISHNHRITSHENAFTPAASSAVFYGKGIFSTAAVYHAKPFLWEKHWRRLTSDAEKIGVRLTKFSEDAVKKSLLEIVEKNEFQTGRARITFFEESLSGGVWRSEVAAKISLLITTANSRKRKNDFRLKVSPFQVNSRSVLAGVKSCNYLENLLALKDAREKGFDEAIRLNERGEVVSASMANIFWVKDERIYTPSLETGCLAGTTREFILENFAASEKRAFLKELFQADEIFLTSTGIGIASVKNIEASICPPSVRITEDLQKFFEDSLAEQNFLDPMTTRK